MRRRCGEGSRVGAIEACATYSWLGRGGTFLPFIFCFVRGRRGNDDPSGLKCDGPYGSVAMLCFLRQ